MQDAPAELAAALTSAEVTWTEPQIAADWAQDGYGADGSIDDLSGIAGRTVISHVLGDNMPSEVSFTKAVSVGTAVSEVDAPDGTPARRYWSPFNTESPIYGFDRDVAPVKIDHGAVTAAGAQQLRLFTGQMADAPISNGRVTLQAISAVRQRLAALVQPRPFVTADIMRDFFRGGNATWVISWAMAQCGVYASPPARDDCIYWAPMHGSGFPFLPSTIDRSAPASTDDGFLLNSDTAGLSGWAGFVESSLIPAPPTWVPGPYVLGASGSADADAHGVYSNPLADQQWEDGIQAIFSPSTNRGRIEFWIRGDDASVNEIPGGSGQLGGFGLGGFGVFDQVGATFAIAGVGVDRKVFVQVDDGANVSTLQSAGTLPTDGEWHFVGAAWDVGGNQLWVNLDGVEGTTTPAPAMTTANLMDGGTSSEFGSASLFFALPVAEIQIYKGDGADPDLSDWGFDIPFEAGAVISPSAIELVAVVEPRPRQAMELVMAYAQAEQAATRTDENDRVLYLPRPYWTMEGQQETVDTVTTNFHAGDPDVRLDTSRIRNVVSARFTDTRVDFTAGPVLELNTVIEIRPGITTLEVTPDVPIVYTITSQLHNLTATEVSTNTLSTVSSGYFAAYSNPEGTGGSYATEAEVTCECVYWDAGLLVFRVTNLTGATWYLLNERDTLANTNISYLRYNGQAAIQTEGSVTRIASASITARGARALDVTLPQVQTRTDADRIALALVGDLAYPTATVDRVDVFGNPRRQPGDLVAFSDEKGSGATGTWRSLKVIHTVNGGEYTQQMQLRDELPVGIWDVTNWDQCVFGAEPL